MHKIAMMFSFAISVLLLSGCAGFSRPALSDATPSTIQQNLARICPVPSNLTPQQAGLIADALEAAPPEHQQGLEILATEWDRLDTSSRICRGESLDLN